MTSQQSRDTRLLTAARDTEEQPHCWLEFKPLSSLQTHCGPKSNNLTVGCSSNHCPHYKHTVDKSLVVHVLQQTSGCQLLSSVQCVSVISHVDCTVYIITVTVYNVVSVCLPSVMLTVQCTSSQSLYITCSVSAISRVDCTVYIITVIVYNVVSVSVISHVACTVYIITVTVYNVVSICHQSC